MKLNNTFLRSCLLGLVAVVVAACSSSSGPAPEGYYRVRAGDNLYKISRRYNQNVNTLIRLNNLRDASQIEVGQLIRVRSGSGVSTLSSRHQVSSRRSVSRSMMGETPVIPVNVIRLQWPVSGGASNVIANYNGSTNKGIDISGTRGTPILAAADGKVLYAGDEVRGYGNMILIMHDNNTLTAYAHNDTMLVKKGDQVRAGQTIATMGSSGTDRVKLHFEVRVNSKAVNPQPYLK